MPKYRIQENHKYSTIQIQVWSYSYIFFGTKIYRWVQCNDNGDAYFFEDDYTYFKTKEEAEKVAKKFVENNYPLYHNLSK